MREDSPEEEELDFNLVFDEGNEEGPAAEEAGTACAASESADSQAEAEGLVLDQRARPEDYEIRALIGKGGYGKVYLVGEKRSGEVYAMKVLRKKFLADTDNVSYTRVERDVMRRVQHPHVVALHSAFQSDERLFMVMEYCPGGHLLTHMRRESLFSEDMARLYLAEVCLALEHLHEIGIIHRDIKPENILLRADGHVCLTDFGLSKFVEPGANDGARTWVGTLEYLAPEVLMGKPYGKGVDWWSFGILAFDMLTGAPPWQSSNEGRLQKLITTGKLHLPRYLSSEASQLISKLLSRDPTKRLAEAKAVQQHPFFRKVPWAKLRRGELPAPFRPQLDRTTPLDLRHVDEAIRNAPAMVSPVHESELPSRSQDALFVGFSWQRGHSPHSPQLNHSSSPCPASDLLSIVSPLPNSP